MPGHRNDAHPLASSSIDGGDPRGFRQPPDGALALWRRGGDVVATAIQHRPRSTNPQAGTVFAPKTRHAFAPFASRTARARPGPHVRRLRDTARVRRFGDRSGLAHPSARHHGRTAGFLGRRSSSRRGQARTTGALIRTPRRRVAQGNADPTHARVRAFAGIRMQ